MHKVEEDNSLRDHAWAARMAAASELHVSHTLVDMFAYCYVADLWYDISVRLTIPPRNDLHDSLPNTVHHSAPEVQPVDPPS